MSKLTLAFDRSARRIDADGRLHVEASRISKAAVNPYYGREIPGSQSLGLEPDKVYRLLRDPVELERAAPTFARLQILSEHTPVNADDPKKEITVGAIGSDVKFDAPYLVADICVWDAEAIAGIESNEVRELSCSYRYIPVMTPGVYDGEAYDGIMTEIQGNHLALVEVGRAGSDVVVADANPFKHEVSAMKMTKLGKALFVALGLASPVLAADSSLPDLVGKADRRTFKRDEIKGKLLALDASLDSNKLDAVLDAILDVEQDPAPVQTPAEDESPAEKVKAMLAGKVDDDTIAAIIALLPAAEAVDEDPDVMKKDDVDKAMDSLRADLRQAEEAKRDVRDVVGDVFGMDSAGDVYAFALDHMKVDHTGVEGVPALRALFKLAVGKQETKQPVIAADGAKLAERFPNATRFG